MQELVECASERETIEFVRNLGLRQLDNDSEKQKILLFVFPDFIRNARGFYKDGGTKANCAVIDDVLNVDRNSVMYWGDVFYFSLIRDKMIHTGISIGGRTKAKNIDQNYLFCGGDLIRTHFLKYKLT